MTGGGLEEYLSDTNWMYDHDLNVLLDCCEKLYITFTVLQTNLSHFSLFSTNFITKENLLDASVVKCSKYM